MQDSSLIFSSRIILFYFISFYLLNLYSNLHIFISYWSKGRQQIDYMLFFLLIIQLYLIFLFTYYILRNRAISACLKTKIGRSSSQYVYRELRLICNKLRRTLILESVLLVVACFFSLPAGIMQVTCNIVKCKKLKQKTRKEEGY